MARRALRILATDVGGTHARAAVVDVTPDRPSRLTSGPPLDQPTPPTLTAFLAWVERIAEQHRPLDGVALGIAGSIRDHRMVRLSPNIPFLRNREADLGAQVTEALGLPCVVVNDMEAALAAEVASGVLQGCRWAFMDTVSTGWGGAFLLDGRIFAAEPGHTPTGMTEGRRCRAGHPDCNEGHFSGAEVEERVRLILKQKKIPLPKGTHPNALADAAVRRNEPWAAELYRYVAEGIGRAWAYRLNVLPQVEKIAYQGGFLIPVMELPLFRETVRETIRAWVMFPEHHRDIPIERAAVDHGALLGAALLFTSLTTAPDRGRSG